MKYLLVPVDGSAPSRRAVTAAVEQAKAFKAKVTLAHVVSSPYRGGNLSGYRVLQEDLLPASYQSEMKMMKELAALFPEDIEVETLIVEGAVATALAKMAKEGPYDFVIMGSEGLGYALKRFLVGSVTKYLIQHVDVPVLVVR